MGLPFLKKDFVSLFFTSGKLQVLHLNPERTLVLKSAAFDLPANSIVNYRLTGKETVVALLKDIWKRLDLKEKSVAIVVPEFSSFTKTLSLPELENQELDEAVRWQFQEFWPQGDGKMIMDWKVVGKEQENLQTLAVAMPEDLLLSFVDIVGEAGLYPLMVETPSLSLVRISDREPSAKLVIYAHFGETVLILAQGEEIFGSSVLASADQAGILWTASQMVRHYQKIEVKRIEVGGLELTQELIDSLQKNLGKPVHWMEAKIGGFSSSQIQEYLVAISSQLKNPAEPRDETTVNLLPESWVKFYENKKLKLQTWSLLVASSVIIWCCFLVTLGVYLLFGRQIKGLQKGNLEQVAALPEEIATQVGQVNDVASRVSKIANVSHLPQEIVNIIIGAKTEGVKIFEYYLDLDEGKIFLKGQAANRQALISFKKALEEKENITQVRVPISAYEEKENLEFEIRFLYGVAERPIRIPIK